MDEDLIKADLCYQQAEKKAADYFKSLYEQVQQQKFLQTLTNDIQNWKRNHIKHRIIFPLFTGKSRKPDTKDYHNYIKWLDYTGKLDNYLDRSISYIYMRDLGKALDSAETQDSIRSAIDSLKEHLTRPEEKKRGAKKDSISMTSLYREAKKEGLEDTMIWVMDKLKSVAENIPEGMDSENAQRKLIKIIGGVLMHEVEEMPDGLEQQQRTHRLDVAIRLGYCYGLTYPFIDDLLDARILSEQETKQYSDLIRTTLVTETVPELCDWHGENYELIRYVHSELKEAFEYIKGHQRPETMKTFFEQSYVFFNSQEVDRVKDLTNPNYTNEEIYIPVILKSSSSRLIVRSVISAPEDEGFDNRTFFYGIYNQLADDFADMFDDNDEGSVTPYTYYMKYHKQRPELINPFELYWTVIANLIHNVYHSDAKTSEVILDRAINGLKRYKERMGVKKYNEVMQMLDFKNDEFSKLIQDMVRKADDVDFFDKLLRDHMITMLKNENQERDDFKATVEAVRERINNSLKIAQTNDLAPINEVIVQAANYSLDGDGKRLRPIVACVMGVDGYGLSESTVLPLLQSLEYMHTASLIFDDLPSQDNAPTRRGRLTLHEVYDTAIAELTGLFLTQRAVEEQSMLDGFEAKTVLRLMRYSAQKTQDMCKGQAMDLGCKGQQLTLEQLNTICFYKTGIAFEASLIMPAILAQAEEKEMEALKRFAHHAGIAFQIKDDLLDVEGDAEKLGKPTGRDHANNSSTFVTVLGIDGARREMWEHYCNASDVLTSIPRNTTFLKHLLSYFVHRER